MKVASSHTPKPTIPPTKHFLDHSGILSYDVLQNYYALFHLLFLKNLDKVIKLLHYSILEITILQIP